MFNEYIFFEQYLYKLKCINLCVRESKSRSLNDCHLQLEASHVVYNKNIQGSNPSSPNYQNMKKTKGESRSPVRLEGQYGCIDLVEIHQTIGRLSRLFVLEQEERQDHLLPKRYYVAGSVSRIIPPPRGQTKIRVLKLLARLLPRKRGRIIEGIVYGFPGYESSTGRKEDGSRTAVQIIIPGLEIPRWLSYQRLGNSVSIKLPPNWCSSKWMGLALCASFNAISSPSSADEFSNPIKTFGLRARVKAPGYMPSEIFFNVKFAPEHIWLLYLSHDDWFATVHNSCNQIEVVFETYSVNVWKCGAGLLYEQDMEEFHKTLAQCGGSSITTYEGWDGVHYEYENSLDPLL